LTIEEQFQEKCEAVFRPELRQNKQIEHLHLWAPARQYPASAFGLIQSR
jgi:hypothetical protein